MNSSERKHIDMEEAKREVKENYQQKTGEELPDHVVENLELLRPGPSLYDFDEMRKGRMYEGTEYEEPDPIPGLFTVLLWAGASGLLGVYASRFFGGWPAQMAAGVFVTLAAAGVLMAVLWGVDRVRN